MSILLHLTATDNRLTLDGNGNPVDLSIEQGADYNKITIQIPGDLTIVSAPLQVSGTNGTGAQMIAYGSIRSNYADLQPDSNPLADWSVTLFSYDGTTNLTTIVPTLACGQTNALPYTNNRSSAKSTAIPGVNVLVYDLWVGCLTTVNQIVPNTPILSISGIPAKVTSNYLVKYKELISADIPVSINYLGYYDYDPNSGVPVALNLAIAGVDYIDNQDGSITLLADGVFFAVPAVVTSITVAICGYTYLSQNTKIASGYVEVVPQVSENKR
jgi:hypothetical protein